MAGVGAAATIVAMSLARSPSLLLPLGLAAFALACTKPAPTPVDPSPREPEPVGTSTTGGDPVDPEPGPVDPEPGEPPTPGPSEPDPVDPADPADPDPDAKKPPAKVQRGKVDLTPFTSEVTVAVGTTLRYSFRDYASVGYGASFSIGGRTVLRHVRTDQRYKQSEKARANKTGADEATGTFVFEATAVGEATLRVTEEFRGNPEHTVEITVTVVE